MKDVPTHIDGRKTMFAHGPVWFVLFQGTLFGVFNLLGLLLARYFGPESNRKPLYVVIFAFSGAFLWAKGEWFRRVERYRQYRMKYGLDEPLSEEKRHDDETRASSV